MKKIIKKIINKISLKEFRARFLNLENKIDLLINNHFTNSKFKNISGLPNDFDPSKYLLLNPDVADAKVDPSEHFLMYGKYENREYKYSNDLENKKDLFHFTVDYQRHVRQLMKDNDIDTAMRLAVGGSWDEMGSKLSKFVQEQGVSSGMDVLDFGCGSGRLAYALAKDVDLKSYVGLDIVKELLIYAEHKCPNNYKFLLNNSLSIPLKDTQFDFAFGFSIFTHLLQTEIMLYSKEIFDLLKPGGIFIYSFMEMDFHWNIFERDYITHKEYSRPYPTLNMFLDRNQVEIMAGKSGFIVEKFIEPQILGQSAVVLKKPI